METRQTLSVGAVVTPGQVDELDKLELPQWLSVPDPKPLSPSKVMRELVHAQYENIFERIVEQIYRGRSLASLLDDDHREISYEGFLRWIKRDPMRHERFKEAQENRSEFIAGEILQIADAEDSIEDVQRSRLKIDTRKWLMSAWNRKRYGETKTLEMAGSISITNALAAARERMIEAEVIDVTPKELDN